MPCKGFVILTIFLIFDNKRNHMKLTTYTIYFLLFSLLFTSCGGECFTEQRFFSLRNRHSTGSVTSDESTGDEILLPDLMVAEDPSSSKITWEYYYKGEKLDFKFNPVVGTENYDEIMDKREEECEKIDKNYRDCFSQRFFINGTPFNGNTCTKGSKSYRVRNFIDGFIEGEFLSYSDGVLAKKGQFSKSLREGRWEFYNTIDYDKQTFELDRFENYKNGLKDGLKVSGFTEPTKKYPNADRDTITYKNGLKHGRSSRWRKEFEGEWIPIEIENYIDGERDGEQMYYDEDGVLEEIRIYKKGLYVKEKYSKYRGYSS